LNANSTFYTFTKNRSEVSTPENNSHTDEFGKGLRIALINPTFTSAAYNNSFYVFYEKNSNTPREYDVIILGHQEYVTQKEYDNLMQFVRSGGTMIILDGNVFYAEVKYDRNTQTITLVKGHGWAFDGKSAWRSVSERWAKETSEWIGSNYLCYSCEITFTNDPFEYRHHEEQYITNPHDIILLNYNASLSNHPIQMRPVIATYELNYQKGKVISLGIYSDDIIGNGRFDRFFDSLLLHYVTVCNGLVK
jgi:hypothetical protein